MRKYASGSVLAGPQDFTVQMCPGDNSPTALAEIDSNQQHPCYASSGSIPTPMAVPLQVKQVVKSGKPFSSTWSAFSRNWAQTGLTNTLPRSLPPAYLPTSVRTLIQQKGQHFWPCNAYWSGACQCLMIKLLQSWPECTRAPISASSP